MCTSTSFDKTMTASTLISRIEALAGPEVAAAIQAEFAGTSVYVPYPIARRAPVPTFRLCGTFHANLPMEQAVDRVASVAIALVGTTNADVVAEIDTTGLGVGYFERMAKTLEGFPGLQVVPMQGAQA